MQEVKNLENKICEFKDIELLILNDNIVKLNNIESINNFTDEYEYDEISIYLNDYITLLFYNCKDKYSIKYNICLEKNLCLKILKKF